MDDDAKTRLKEYKRGLAAEKRLTALLSGQGIEARCAKDIFSPNVYVESVKLEFTPKQWVDICDIDGESLGSCCSVISSIRSHLMVALRHSGFIDANDLEDVVALMRSHDPQHDNLVNRKPLNKLIFILETIKKHIRPRNQKKLASAHPEKLKDALGILSDCAENLHAKAILDRKDPAKCPHQLLMLARLLPALRTVWTHLNDEAKFKPIDGYVIRHRNELVTLKDSGYAFFTDKAEAERILDFLAQRLADPKDRAEYDICFARISLHEGIVLLN